MLLYGSLAMCAILATLLVYRYDMYEREPWFMVVVAVGLGWVAMWLAGLAEGWTLDRFGEVPRPDVIVAAVAATHEELACLLVVIGLAKFVPRQFNDPMDGIIYGSLVGVGMAIDESVFFLGLGADTAAPLPPAEIIRITGHLVMGGITGFAIGMARMRMKGWPRVLAFCLVFSIGLHFLWDCLAFSSIRQGVMTPLQTAAAIGLMLGGILFYGALVVVGSEWSRRVFAPQSMKSLWGWPFTLLRRPNR
jgi:RsiW-degrading membrane proteinase PrsW (M82 family)